MESVNEKTKQNNNNSEDEFQKLINNSGHNFHFEIVELLRNEGWETEISPYYYDDTMNKPREVDIIASKEIGINEIAGSFYAQFKDRKELGYKIYLFIECKHLTKETVLWMDIIKSKRAKETVANSIVNIDLGGGDRIFNIEQIFGLGLENHHYSYDNFRVAKLFETKGINSGQDVIFKAFSQSIKSLIFNKQQNKRIRGVYYPMVIYEPTGKIAYFAKEEKEKYKLIDEFILEVNYSYKHLGSNIFTSENFLVDFMTKGKLLNFFDSTIKKEIEEINSLIIRNIKDKSV